MRYAQIENGKVINVIELAEGATEWQGLLVVPSDTAAIGDDHINGEIVKPEPIVVPETPEQTIARLDNAIEAHIQSVISNLGYESLDRLVGVYSDSPNQTWKAEALGAKNWITALWETALQIEQDVTNGTRPIPTEQELIAELPIITDYIVYPV